MCPSVLRQALGATHLALHKCFGRGLILHTDAHHLEPLPRMLPTQRAEVREGGAAGTTPAGPELDEEGITGCWDFDRLALDEDKGGDPRAGLAKKRHVARCVQHRCGRVFRSGWAFLSDLLVVMICYRWDAKHQSLPKKLLFWAEGHVAAADSDIKARAPKK